MINFLSEPAVITPQIDFLLFLQNIRTGSFEIFDKFFLSVTLFGEFLLPTLLSAVVYWCIDSKAGIYLFSLEGLNVLFVHLFKMLACVYRPWVLDARMHPSALAVPYAKGYSFPSGHSAMSSSVFGGLAYLLRKKKAVCALLICLVLLVGFSRLWLGVHTPQDVLCGLLTGLILVFAVNKMIDYAEKDKNRYLYLLAIINVFALIAIIYIYYFNQYRIDYVDGKILVNPLKAKYLTCLVYGWVLGLIDGAFLCRRFFSFEIESVPVKTRVIRAIIGCTFVFIVIKNILNALVVNVYPTKSASISMFAFGLFITLIYPLIFTFVEKIAGNNKNNPEN